MVAARGLQGSHLSTDLPAVIMNLSAQRENIAGNHSSGMQDHVSVDRHEVTTKGPVDIGIAVDHQQVTLEIFRRAQAEVTFMGAPVRNGQMPSAPIPVQGRAEPRFNKGRPAEIAEVDGRAALGYCLRFDPMLFRLRLRMKTGGDVPHEDPELINQVCRGAPNPRLGPKWPDGQAEEAQNEQ
jgi:hypothetical protein